MSTNKDWKKLYTSLGALASKVYNNNGDVVWTAEPEVDRGIYIELTMADDYTGTPVIEGYTDTQYKAYFPKGILSKCHYDADTKIFYVHMQEETDTDYHSDIRYHTFNDYSGPFWKIIRSTKKIKFPENAIGTFHRESILFNTGENQKLEQIDLPTKIWGHLYDAFLTVWNDCTLSVNGNINGIMDLSWLFPAWKNAYAKIYKGETIFIGDDTFGSYGTLHTQTKKHTDSLRINPYSFIEVIGPYAFRAYKTPNVVNLQCGRLQYIQGYAFIANTIDYLYFENKYYMQQTSVGASDFTLTSILEGAFYNCGTIQNKVSIPGTVTNIGKDAFKFTTLSQGIQFWSETPPTLGNNALGDLSGRGVCIEVPKQYLNNYRNAESWQQYLDNLPEPEVQGNNQIFYTSTAGNIIEPNNIEYESNVYEDGLGIITCANDITSIPNEAFLGKTNLSSITLPNSVTSIGNSAFYGCSSITSITLPNSVTSIGNSAFYGCSSITSITLPNSVTSIEYEAFNLCIGITSLTIPASLTNIDNRAFINCTGIESITVDENNTIYDSRDNCNAIIETSKNELVYGCKNTIIPNSVTSIGNVAFDSCTGLTSINIPDSVTRIGAYAFSNCKGLTSITIPDSVTSIDYYAFAWSTITSITIPDSVTSIAYYVFYGCLNLTSITIPDSVTTIGHMALANCTNLKSITIPASVTSIDTYVFYNSGVIKTASSKVELLGTTPPTLGSLAFGYTSSIYAGFKFTIPEEAIEDYRSESSWQQYIDYLPGDEERTEIKVGSIYTIQPYLKQDLYVSATDAWEGDYAKHCVTYETTGSEEAGAHWKVVNVYDESGLSIQPVGDRFNHDLYANPRSGGYLGSYTDGNDDILVFERIAGLTNVFAINTYKKDAGYLEYDSSDDYLKYGTSSTATENNYFVITEVTN